MDGAVKPEEPTKRSSPVKPELFMPAKIAEGLWKAQEGLKPLARTSDNESFNSKFTPLPDVMTVALKLLNKQGIAVTQSPITDENGHSALRTSLVHKSGVGYSETTKLAVKAIDPQSHASAITYMRRYMIMAILGLTSLDDDDDGNKAAGVVFKPTTEQIDRIKKLLTDLRYPPEQIAADVFKIKTRDHADLAILNYEKIVSMRVREKEATDVATDIEVNTAVEFNDHIDVDAANERMTTVAERLEDLNLKDVATMQQFVNVHTGKATLADCKPWDLKKLEAALDRLESGKEYLPADYYGATTEQIIVDEPVA